MFTINNLEHFIKPFLENPADEYKGIGLFVFFFRFLHHSEQWCYFFSFVVTVVFLTSLTVTCMYISSVMFLFCMLCNSSDLEPSPQYKRWSSNCNSHFSLPSPSCVRAGPPQRAGGCLLLLRKPLWARFFVMWAFVQCLFNLLYYFMCTLPQTTHLPLP